MADEIIVYGSSWCGYTNHTLRTLKKLGVAYRYIEVDDDPEAERRIAGWNHGRSIRPTIDMSGDIFINPDDGTLFQELQARGLLMQSPAGASETTVR